MITSSVTLKSRFPHARALLEEALARALAQTGRKIAERTQDNMHPGHFLETGLSQEETTYEQLTPTSGQVHIATEYAAYAELGTAQMAPRPVLRPAIDQSWPLSLQGYWGQAMRGLKATGTHTLPPIDPPGPPAEPIGREVLRP